MKTALAIAILIVPACLGHGFFGPNSGGEVAGLFIGIIGLVLFLLWEEKK